MPGRQKNIDLRNTGLPGRLHSLREARSLTKTDLAEAAELSARTVHDLEKGRRSRVQEKTLILLARALDVSVNELLGRDPAEAQETNGLGVAEREPGRRLYLSRPAGLGILVALLIVLGFALANAWTFARTNAKWKIDGNRLTASDAVFGARLWELESPGKVTYCEVSPWRDDLLLVGARGQDAQVGCLLALERASGDTVWIVQPDVAAVERAFDKADVRTAQFNFNRLHRADLDGDGHPELVVAFTHGLYYPFVLCAVDETGRVLGQYAHKGHLSQQLVVDLDGDGRDEFLAAGTNNAPDYQGAAFVLLDREHWFGASIDSLCDPWSSEPDSARIRLVIPQYPGPYMKMLQANRLAVMELRVHRDPDGEVLMAAQVGRPEGCNMIVYLDGELRPQGCVPTDAFNERWISQWPDSLTRGTGPGDPAWRAEWLAHYRRFEAGHWPPAGE